MDWELIGESWPVLVAAIPETLVLAISSLAIGFVLAIGIAVLRLSDNRLAWAAAYGYVYVFRSTPLLVQIFLIYYGSGQFRPFFEDIGLWYFLRDPWFCAITALTLNTAAYASEIIRGGIQSVPWGQLEAARACGMSGLLLFRRIIFPIAIRQALPGYGNEIILMVKATSLASTITILEVTGEAKKIIAATWSPVEVFIIAGAIYLAINFAVTRIVQWAEVRLSPQLYRDRPSWFARLTGAGADTAGRSPAISDQLH
ncbi:MAG: ABC transporter permease [Alphaproteobacteria bacterium]|jgi:octopine/nopaline transport system permease protein|nr:ABC transporter permease [Alphaproteobacteria bacterium]MDP6564071.1 ABC transporter permease [Alphaproteobacteria bacterium]MDP6812749.1 ABC transporter permease [Alphaproteobacteria bacterium]